MPSCKWPVSRKSKDGIATALPFAGQTKRRVAMTLVKTDRPRRIDRVIDYFGDLCHEASNDPRPVVDLSIHLEGLAEARAI
jgi:hypothetical protein